MKPSQTPRRKPVVRKTFAVFAMLGAGILAGAFLGEMSVLDFNFAVPSSLHVRHSGPATAVNGYLPSTDSLSQSRRPVSQPRGVMAHHMGI